MKVFNFAICDDEEVAVSAIMGSLSRLCAVNGVSANIDCFRPERGVENKISEGNYNAVFLDINMPGFDGIELGILIKRKNSSIDIIYVSSEEVRVFETFEVRPYGFVRKSNFNKDLARVIKMYLAEHSETGRRTIEIQSPTSIENIDVNDIVYIESLRECQYITMKNKSKKRIRLSMNILEKQLQPIGFIRIHKSYLVNYSFIRRIDRSGVIINTGENLPISRKKVQEVRQQFMKLNRKDISLVIGAQQNSEDDS